MNIQIFGTKKCNDTKKAERFFKERGIKYQFIDMKEKGMLLKMVDLPTLGRPTMATIGFAMSAFLPLYSLIV